MTIHDAQAFLEHFAASGGLYFFLVAVLCGVLHRWLS